MKVEKRARKRYNIFGRKIWPLAELKHFDCQLEALFLRSHRKCRWEIPPDIKRSQYLVIYLHIHHYIARLSHLAPYIQSDTTSDTRKSTTHVSVAQKSRYVHNKTADITRKINFTIGLAKKSRTTPQQI